MALPSVSVNYVSVLIAAVASYIIGMIWYTFLFGKIWMKEMGFKDKDKKKAKKEGMAVPMVLNFLGALVSAYVLALLLGWGAIGSVGDAAMFAFWVWLGFFAATTLLGDVLWEMKSWKLFFINAAYWLVNLLVMSYILIAWA
jgi:hypothetical protein